MIIAFDLDDTLCSRTSEEGGIAKYHTAYPIQRMVDICNECYDSGHHIVIYTARGMMYLSGSSNTIINELFELTKNQLREWGIKHHELVMCKLHYDVLIDDKVLNSEDVTCPNDINNFLLGTPDR